MSNQLTQAAVYVMNNNEIPDMKVLVERVDGLETRISDLERLYRGAGGEDQAPVLEPAPAPASEPVPVEPEPVGAPKVSMHEQAQEENTVKSDRGDSLEQRIGLYWLSKLGIGFLVVGVALLIVYSFKNFGPAAKIATGFIVSSLLMAAGEYMEKRDDMPWYARLLEGGAWALGYFTTYAMYHVESVKLIQDPLTDLILLLGVSGLAVAHAVGKRSQVMAICAVTLGFLTLTMSHLTGFSTIAAALLVALSVFLTVRQKWYHLFFYSVFASYGAFLANGSLNVTLHTAAGWAPYELPETAFRKICLVLAPGLIGFGLVPILGVAREGIERRLLTVATIVNAAAFSTFFFSRAYDYFGTGASIYNLLLAAWFFALAVLVRRSGNEACATINSLFALTVGSCYFAGAHVGRMSWPYLAFEVALLAWCGLAYKIRSFRWFAIALGVVVLLGNFVRLALPDTIAIFGQTTPFSLLSGLCAVAALAVAACAQKHKAMLANASAGERTFAFFSFWNMALALAWCLPAALVSVPFDGIGLMPETFRTPTLLAGWSSIAAAVLAMAVVLRSPYMQGLTIFLFLIVGLPAVSDWHFQWINSIDAVLVMLASAFVMRHYAARFSQSASLLAFHLQFVFTYLFVGLLPVGASWSGDKLAIYWAVQAVSALALGIGLKDQALRMITPFAFIFAAIATASNTPDWWFVIPVVCCFYAAWGLYMGGEKFGLEAGESSIRHLYSYAGALMLTMFFGQKLQRTWISCAWAMEGFSMLTVGFLLREKQVRLAGLFVFATLVVRLFFVDLAGTETIYRIFAFIVAGVVLLVSAYAYTLFARKFDFSENGAEKIPT